MALVNIVYVHSKEPEGTDLRRSSIDSMVEYMERLVFEMKFAGVSTDFKSEHRDGVKNDVIVNGRLKYQRVYKADTNAVCHYEHYGDYCFFVP